MAIRIPIIADVVDAIRGALKLGQSFDDVADSLDDVQHEAKSAGGPVEDVGDHAAATSRDAETMEKSFRDAFDTVRKESKSAGDDVGTSMRHGTDAAGEGVQEFGREADSTAKETAASFDGSAQSITGAFQEIAANAFGGFGPAGAVAGLAAAAGIGILTSKMEEAKEKAADAAAEIAEITGQLIELGSRHLDAESVRDAIAAAGSEADDGKIPIQEWAKAASGAGIDFATYAQGMAGDSKAIARSYAEVNEAIAAKSDELSRLGTAQGKSTDEVFAAGQAGQKELEALGKVRDALEAKDGTLNKSADTYGLVTEAQAGLTIATEAQIAADEHAAEVHESYTAALEATADPVSVYEGILSEKEAAERATAEATAAATKDSKDSWEDYAQGVTVTTDDLIAEWNRQAAENEAFAANLAIIGANGGQALADELRAKGPEVAGATAAAIAQSDPAVQQAAIDAHAKATGAGIATGMATGITDGQGKVQTSVDQVAAGVTPPGIMVSLLPDPSALEAELAKPRTIEVNVHPKLGMAAV